MSNQNSRPEIAETVSHMEDYGTVFIGFRFGGMLRLPLSTPLWKAMPFRERLLFPLQPAAAAEWVRL